MVAVMIWMVVVLHCNAPHKLCAHVCVGGKVFLCMIVCVRARIHLCRMKCDGYIGACVVFTCAEVCVLCRVASH